MPPKSKKPKLLATDHGRSEEGVISVNPSSEPTTAKKQPILRYNFFFTYNNYKIEEIDHIVSTLKKFAYKGKIQTEVGEKGTPHLQGMIWCKTRHRDTEFKLPKGIWWDTLKDEQNQSDYCGKDKTHDGIFRTSWGFPKPLHYNLLETSWVTWLQEMLDKPPESRKIIWLWSQKGKLGKTQLIRKYMIEKGAQYASGGKYTDVMNLVYNTDMDTCEHVFFNLPLEHRNHISYSALEAIKDGLVSNMKSFKNGSKVFTPPHVVVFSNYPPESNKLMPDRWVIHQIDYMNGIPSMHEAFQRLYKKPL